ncbi:MAG: hypothetical protein ACSHXB_05610 [Sulfitobacter sp.]
MAKSVGTHLYTVSLVCHAPASVVGLHLAYDANGNMLNGLDGKVMSYDGENRPLSVAFAGKKTCYVYGVDGKRLKKIENFGPTQSCAAPTSAQPVTLYLGSNTEIRNYGQGAQEEILLYPMPSIRIAKTKVGGNVVTKVSTLHTDALGSVRAVTNAAGQKAERATYRPFGEQTEALLTLDGNPPIFNGAQP